MAVSITTDAVSGRGRASAILTLAGFASVAITSTTFGSTISDPFLVFHASNAQGAGVFSVPLVDTTPGPAGSRTWSLLAPVNIMSGPNLIATISQASAQVRPLNGALANTITVGFTVISGSSDTDFTVDSALLTIDSILDQAGRMSASFGVTDQDNNGVTLTGLNGDGSAFRTAYNGQVPGGITFHNSFLLPVGSPNGGGSANASDSFPGGGVYLPIGPHVDDMSSEWHFRLTAGDTFGGSGTYSIIPTPGAISLLALGGLGLVRRSRR